MFITIQFPIADLRPFIKQTSRLLHVNLANNKGFIRSFGKIQTRMNGWTGPKDWATDAYFSSAKNALLVPDLGQYYEGHQDQSPSVLLKPYYLLRRLFCDGRALTRIEVGLSLDSPIKLDKKQLLSVIKDFLSLPTKVRSIQGEYDYIDNILLNQGDMLARLFLYATTPVAYLNTPEFHHYHVIEGSPILFFEYEEDFSYSFPYSFFPFCKKNSNQSFLPDGIKKIPSNVTNNVNLSYYSLKFQRNSIGVWFIGRNSENKEQVRLLKICLLRLHAEQEVLKKVIFFAVNAIKTNPDSLDHEVLGNYLDDSTKVIFKKHRNGVHQEKILDVINQCESLVNNTTLEIIENALISLDQIRIPRQTKKKVYDFLDTLKEILINLPTISITGVKMGDIISAGDNATVINRSIMQNAFNKIKSEHNEEAAKALTRIEEAINKAGNKEATKHFELFNKELVKPEPEKSLLEILWQGTLTAMPALKELVGVSEQIAKLFI